MEHIQAFTDKPHAREDLALACRQVISNDDRAPTNCVLSVSPAHSMSLS